MRRYVVALALFGAAVLASSTLTAEEPKKDEKKDAKTLRRRTFGKLMKETHRGDKSPHARIVAELKKDAPDWEQLAKDAKAFAAMGEAFKGVRLDYSSPAGYIESTHSLHEGDRREGQEGRDRGVHRADQVVRRVPLLRRPRFPREVSSKWSAHAVCRRDTQGEATRTRRVPTTLFPCQRSRHRLLYRCL